MSSHNWPPVGGSSYWGDAVASSGSLPASGAVTGEVRLVLDTDDLYQWNGSSWIQITENLADVTGPASSTDNAIARFDGTGGKTLQNSGVLIDDSDNVTGVNNLGIDGYVSTPLNVGDPGSEASGININGTTYASAAKINDIGTSNIAQFVIHRHSTTLEPLIVGARANSETSSHSNVTNGMTVFSLYGAGWAGSSYHLFSQILFKVDASGTVSNSSAPGTIDFRVTPNGAVTPASAMTIRSDRSVEFQIATASRVPYLDANKALQSSSVTPTELGYVSGVTSAIQTQLDGKVDLAGDTMTGDLVLAGDPDSALKAATKQYVDSVAAGLDVKASVLVLSDSDITLSGEQTLDGVLTSTSRVLVTGQTATEENGIYVSAAGAWSRATDMDSWDEVPGAFVFVEQGSTYADTGWVCTADAGGTLGTTAISWSQFAGAGTYTADGQGIELTGTQFSLEIDGSTLSKSGTGIKVADGSIGDTQLDGNITRTELATGTAYRILANDASGDISENAAITASRAVASDVNGQLVASSTTSTELGYVNGVTSAIQTQLNNVRAHKSNVSVSSDVTLTDQAIHFVDSSVARNLTLPAPAANSYVVLKDVTGSAQAHSINVLPNFSESIDGTTSYTIDWNYGSATFVSDGTDWFVI